MTTNDLKSLKAEAARLEAAVTALGGEAYQFQTKLTRPGVRVVVGFKGEPSIALIQNVMGPRPSPELADVFGKEGYEVRRVPRRGTVGQPASTLFLRDGIALAVFAVKSKEEIGKYAVIIELTPHNPR